MNSVNQAENHCHERIEVDHTYLLNKNLGKDACQNREPARSVKVLEIKEWAPGKYMARLDFPRHSSQNPNEETLYLTWVSIDRLYSVKKVCGNFTPLSHYTRKIQS